MARPADERTAEERLADQLAAELEEEFGTEEEPAPAPQAPAKPAPQPLPVSAEEVERAKAEAKGRVAAEPEKALEPLSARSPTAYTRHPIVSVLGHVDHGKTSILDRIRGTKVFDREAGAITQHIGASEVPLETIFQRCGPLLKGKSFGVPGLLFIDTPGHHAFSSLRKRGGALADIAVLVVDITEGLMPQTLEAIQILRSSKTPFVVAANKVDRIQGWTTADKPFLLNIRDQGPSALESFDTAFYTLVAALFKQGLPAERYDRISDFTKNIAIVPTCARSGEGIPDLLAMLVGLAQRFLEGRLETDENTPGEGTVLEVKQDKGLGPVLDVILYAGKVRKDDTVLVGTRSAPLESKIKALLKPAANDEMRDARKAFRVVDEVVAAAGIRLVLPNMEGVLAGAPLRVIRKENREAATEAVLAASRPQVELSDTGVFVKADTIGGLEALAGMLKERGVPIRNADVGDVSRRDVIEAASMGDPSSRVLLGFSVKLLPDVEREAKERDLPVFTNDVLYGLIDEFDAWSKAEKERQEKQLRQEHHHPAKIRFLPGCSFRMRDPAVFGVRVLAGSFRSGRMIVRDDGKPVGRVKSIQKDNKSVDEAHVGDEVAISVPGPTIGRQIHEEDILYLDIPEGDVKWLLTEGNISAEEKDSLMELVRVRRKEDRYWGM
ncbi:MAG: translation initiation factor IF-2 [Thermoplasmatota archaeon]